MGKHGYHWVAHLLYFCDFKCEQPVGRCADVDVLLGSLSLLLGLAAHTQEVFLDSRKLAVGLLKAFSFLNCCKT